MKKKFSASFIILNVFSSSAFAAISIQLSYTNIGAGGVNNSGITESQQLLFDSAKSTWEKHLTGYREAGGPDSILMNISGPAIDGEGGILGSAGPEAFVDSQNFVYTTEGTMQFDSADIAALEADRSLESVVFHEMGHILGIGTLWREHGLYADGSFQYTGATALEKYQRDFDPNATFIPVEQNGGPGTAQAHWDEDPQNPSANNPDAPYDGSSFNDEIMTGFSSGVLNYLSDVTIGSFYDMGYTVDYLVFTGPFYWDAGNPTSDGAITSGDGIWDLANTNFANEDGSENVVYQERSVLYFTDRGSVVTLDGEFNPAEIFVEADGYTFQGGGLDTTQSIALSVVNAAHTLNLDSPVIGTGTIQFVGDGTVNNLNEISASILLNAGTLLNNGTGTITGNITVAEGTRLQTDDQGLGNAVELTNSGSVEITADQTIRSYTASGRLFGAGKLTADSFALNDGASVESELAKGNITTNGAVAITKATEGNLTVASGITTLTGNNAGDINISSGAQLNSAANTLSDTAVVTNAGILNLQGGDTVASYDGSGGILRGNGIFRVGSFKGGTIETRIDGDQSLDFSVDSGGGTVTLGAGSTLKWDTASGPYKMFDAFTLFSNVGGAGIIGDATSIGFENFDNSLLEPGLRAVFNVQTGQIIISGNTLEDGGSVNSDAIATGLLGGTLSDEPIINISSISGNSIDVINRIRAFADVSDTDNVTIQTQLQEISPEVYGSVADYSLRQHLSYTNIVRYAPYMIRSGKFQVFAGANSQSIETKNSLNDADYELQGTGGYFGVTNELSNHFRLGAYGAYDTGDISSERLSLESKGSVIGAFAEWNVLMPWENDQKYGVITAGVSFGKFDFEGSRVAQVLNNSVNEINSTTLEFGLGYKVALIDTVYFKLSPFISANYITAEVDGFTETGTINSVSVRDHEKNLMLLNYGLEAEWLPTADAFGFTAKVAFQNNFGDEATEFESAIGTSSDFNILSPGLSEQTIEGRLGMFYKFSNNARVGASYFMLSGDDIETASGGNVGISLQW